MRLWAVLWALGLTACGGEAEHDPTHGAGSESGGSAGTAATDPGPTPMSLSEWPWFLSAAGETSSEMLYSDEDGLTLSFSADAERMQLQTHNHFDLLADRRVIAFDVSANREQRLIVAFTNLDFGSDYWTDLAAGTPWRAYEIGVDPNQVSFALPLADFAALGPGTPRPLNDAMGTVIWFLVEDAANLELTLANIRLE
jgi:hypothetical protein